MKKSPIRTAMGMALGTAMIGALSVSTNASADASPFQMKTLSSGIVVAGGEGRCGEGKCGGSKKTKEGKCGEGKCGSKKSSKKSMEGKCGEGKCGGSKAPMSQGFAVDCVYDEDMCG